MCLQGTGMRWREAAERCAAVGEGAGECVEV
jgi:hypothetical protein